MWVVVVGALTFSGEQSAAVVGMHDDWASVVVAVVSLVVCCCCCC